MAIVNKDFKIKSGLIVEGTTAKVNNFDILTRNTADQNYIVGLIGGTSSSANLPDTVVKRDSNGDFSAGEVTLGSLVLNGQDLSVTLGNLETNVVLQAGVYTDGEIAVALNTAQGYATTAETNANGYTNSQITTTVAAAQGFANIAQSNAESTASLDATSKADAAQAAAATDATTKANAAQSNAEQNAAVDATTKADAARVDAVATASADATSKADSARSLAVSTASADATVKADAAEFNAKAHTDSLVGDSTVDGTTGNTVTDRIAVAVADLVDGAPALLDTLNELASAIGGDANFATSLTNLVATKADTSYVDSEISDVKVEAASDATTKANAARSGAEATASADASTKADAAQAAAIAASATDASDKADVARASAISASAVDATTKADAARSGAESTAAADATVKADLAELNATLAASADATQKANTALADAIAHSDALDTDDIAEGTAQYFTDSRAKSSAADLLTGANLTNITITGTGSGLTITAENGVADSDTDDLVEGSTNLYFTDTRAVQALESVVPNFTAVELSSVAKQVASTFSAPTASIGTAYNWSASEYRSAEFLVKVSYGSHTEISKVLLTLDTSDNIAITEYGIVGTNGSASSISAVVTAGLVELQVSTMNNNSTVTVMGTLLA